TDRVYGLPNPPVKCKIGSAAELRLQDGSGLLSREHAELVPLAEGGWKIRDLKSKNGLRCDGEPLASFSYGLASRSRAVACAWSPRACSWSGCSRSSGASWAGQPTGKTTSTKRCAACATGPRSARS